MPLIHLPVSSQASGVLRSPNDNNSIQSPVTAEVKQVNIQENRWIDKGDTLLLLNTEITDAKLRFAKDNIKQNECFISDINHILSKNTSLVNSSQYKAEYAYYRSLLDDKQTNLSYLQNEFNMQEYLYNNQVIAKQEFLKHKNNLDLAQRQLTNTCEQYISQWQTEKVRLIQENKDLRSQIAQLQEERSKYIITAPYSGTIINYTGIQKGNYVTTGQVIAYISSTDSILVECYALPKDIGFLQVGQKVTFQVDAFNYNQWGLAKGELKEISSDVIQINDNAYYLVRCELNTPYLKLTNGYKGELKKGMTVTGRFYLTERTIWQLLFDKIDDWMNPTLN